LPPISFDDLEIIPGLPDANSGKIYRLQLGTSFPTKDAANEMAEMIAGVGFKVALELDGPQYRVTAVDIPSTMVFFALQRLGFMGIRQIWVKE